MNVLALLQSSKLDLKVTGLIIESIKILVQCNVDIVMVFKDHGEQLGLHVTHEYLHKKVKTTFILSRTFVCDYEGIWRIHFSVIALYQIFIVHLSSVPIE